jgi:hypothetical protein
MLLRCMIARAPQKLSESERARWLPALHRGVELAQSVSTAASTITLTRHKSGDGKFAERFNVPTSESVVEEFECQMRVDVVA